MAAYRDSRSGKIRFQFTDYKGARRTATPPEGTSWAEAENLFHRTQAEHDAIRRGFVPAPKPSESTLLESVLDDYMTQGKQKGMNPKKPRPWSDKHVAMQVRMKRWVLGNFGVRFIGELENGLPLIEERLADLYAEGPANGGLSGKATNGYGSALHTFLSWCVSRSHLEKDPMANWQPYDGTPAFVRRAPTLEEVGKLISTVPPERRLLYLVAICSGFRANELRQLLIRHLTDEGFALPAPVAKNRKAAHQPLPRWLVEELRGACSFKLPEAQLFDVPKNTAAAIRTDFRRAGVTENLDTLDFQAFGRVGYVNLVLGTGARLKEAMELTRHSTPDLILNTYGRVVDERMREITEKVGDMVRTKGA